MKKTSVILLTLLLAASVLAGCATPAATTATPAAPAGATAAAASPTPAPAVQPTPAAQPTPAPAAAFTQNDTGPIVDKPITLRGFVYENTQFNANHEQMAFWKNLSAETNINFTFERIPGEAWREKLNLLLVSGDLPDFIGGTYTAVNADDIAKYAKKAFLDVSGLLEANAPNLTKLIAEDPQLGKVMRSLDGGVYSFPSRWTEVEQNVGGMPFINQAWLSKLSLKMPGTLDELYDVLAAFKTKDPNGNGKPDEIPLSSMDKSLNSVLSKVVAGAYGVPYYGSTNIAIGKDGKAYYSAASEGYKEAVKYVARLYQDKLLDQEIFSIDRAKFVAKANQGRANQTVGLGLSGIMEQNFFGKDSIDDYVPLTGVKGPSGESGIINENAAYLLNTFVITTANKYPAETVRLVDRLYSPLWSLQMFEGPVGTAIQLSSDGKRYEYMKPTGDLSIDQMRYQSAPVSMPYYLSDERMTSMFVPDPLMMENTWNNCRLVMPHLIPQVNPPVWPMTPEDSKTVAQMRVELDNLVQSKRAAWVTGTASIDAEWDAYLATLNQLGMKQYVELYEKAYVTFNK